MLRRAAHAALFLAVYILAEYYLSECACQPQDQLGVDPSQGTS